MAHFIFQEMSVKAMCDGCYTVWTLYTLVFSAGDHNKDKMQLHSIQTQFNYSLYSAE